MSSDYAAEVPWVAKHWHRWAMGHSGGRGRRRGPWFGPGGFPMGGPGPFFRGRAKVGRGDVRVAILALLTEEPMHGYQIMQELSERTGGVWQPSPGSVYPTLQQLEDEGLVQSEDREGKKVFRLTETGRERAEVEAVTPPWEAVGMDAGLLALRDTGFQAGAAVMQVAHHGTEEQIEAAREILAETRARLYALLGEEGDESLGQ
jgi:DNA-binding PadR family transcriptional regulator